jgi:guanylate kinase
MSAAKGKLIIICAPSGSGKTTIVKSVLATLPQLEFSVSATSRQPRQGEKDGKDYYFISADEFKSKISHNAFLEWEEVYENSFYGTLRSEIDRIWQKENHVIFDVDVMGGISIKKQYPDDSLAVFIMPPSVDELKKRLTGRGTETPESLARRVEKAEQELSFASHFDVIIINDVLEKAIEEARNTIVTFLEK